MPQAGYIADKVVGHQQLTLDAATAQGLTPPTSGVAKPTNTAVEWVEVIAETNSVRWRADGTDPTAAIGQLIPVGISKEFRLSSFAALKFIASVVGATLNVTYYSR